MPISHQNILDFWFPPDQAPAFKLAKQSWFSKDDAFDKEITRRFVKIHQTAAVGELDHWMETAEGSLALILLLDQFPRNMFRDSAKAFATDPQAREIARNAIKEGFDKNPAWSSNHRIFFYLPFEHSEDLADQKLCLELIKDVPGAMEEQGFHYWAEAHYRIIERFGRFPHRNQALGRDNTVEETAFLLQSNSGF